MPAYSFKERFVPMIKDGSKLQTIRTFRNSPVTVGQTAYLYYGMRTKYCTRLIEPTPISGVNCIAINPCGTVWIITTNWLDKLQREQFMRGKFHLEGAQISTLNQLHKDNLAWRDGFRHEDDPKRTEGCFEIMFRWWKQTHELPFIGNIISWSKPKI